MASVRRPAFRFDRSYYQRYYEDRRTAVNSREDMRRLARFVVAYVRYLDLPVKRILDAGCGCGWLKGPFARQLPSARYTGLEYSEYLCERFGWTQGSVASFRSRYRFDIVTCNGVLQYLDDRAAARAIANLGRLCGGVLYFNALTAEDWRGNADRTLTDGDVHIRDADWYRTRLRKAFVEIGGGLWLRRGIGIPLWSLERR